jgi:hypothetical protein
VAILSFLNKNGLWISWPLLGLGVFLLWFFILKVIRLGSTKIICNLPLTAEQEVEFPEAGRVILWLEGPLLTTRFAGIAYELTGSDGSSTKGRRTWFRIHSSSFSRVRIVDRVFEVPHPGRYVLRTNGLGAPRAADDKHRILFMRPYLPQSIGCILGILLGSFLVIGSIVNFSIRFWEEGPA